MKRTKITIMMRDELADRITPLEVTAYRVGEYFAVHAGRYWDPEAERFKVDREHWALTHVSTGFAVSVPSDGWATSKDRAIRFAGLLQADPEADWSGTDPDAIAKRNQSVYTRARDAFRRSA